MLVNIDYQVKVAMMKPMLPMLVKLDHLSDKRGSGPPSNDTPISLWLHTPLLALVARRHGVLQEDARWKLNAILQEKSPFSAVERYKVLYYTFDVAPSH